MPTVAGLTPREHEVVLCDENVEDDRLRRRRRHRRRHRLHRPQASACSRSSTSSAAAGASSWSAGRTPRSAPRSCAAAATCSSSTRPRRPGRSSSRDFAAGDWQAEYRPAEKPDLTTSPTPRFDLLKVDRYHAHDDPVRARLPVQLRVLRHHRRLRTAPAREGGRAGDGGDRGVPPPGRHARSSSSTTTSSATRSSPRSCCARSRRGARRAATRSTSTPRCR